MVICLFDINLYSPFIVLLFFSNMFLASKITPRKTHSQKSCSSLLRAGPLSISKTGITTCSTQVFIGLQCRNHLLQWEHHGCDDERVKLIHRISLVARFLAIPQIQQGVVQGNLLLAGSATKDPGKAALGWGSTKVPGEDGQPHRQTQPTVTIWHCRLRFDAWSLPQILEPIVLLYYIFYWFNIFLIHNYMYIYIYILYIYIYIMAYIH